MSEAREIAESLINKHGAPNVTSHDTACAWLEAHWPDWQDWMGFQMRDNIADALLAKGE